jgi:CheY-like chemotaxis protein
MLAFRPDVVTCDLDMPGTSGFEFVQKLAKHEEFGPTRPPVIAVSACGREQQALESGFDAHLVKPVEAWRLAKELAKVANSPQRPR